MYFLKFEARFHRKTDKFIAIIPHLVQQLVTYNREVEYSHIAKVSQQQFSACITIIARAWRYHRNACARCWNHWKVSKNCGRAVQNQRGWPPPFLWSPYTHTGQTQCNSWCLLSSLCCMCSFLWRGVYLARSPSVNVFFMCMYGVANCNHVVHVFVPEY